MRVLGIDPGLSRCGFGVVEGSTNRAVLVRAGLISTLASEPTARRLAGLYQDLRDTLEALRPDAVAVERVFFNANVATATGVGQAAGVALLCAAQAGCDVTEYTPTQVKAAVTGSGDADKGQVGFMVRTLLRLTEAPRPADAADALALALCHLRRGGAITAAGGMSPRLAAAVEAAGPGAAVWRRREGGAEDAAGGRGP